MGKTNNPTYRLADHFSEGGSHWTKKYKPISIHELRPDRPSTDEQVVTQGYMQKYGIDNVRGGPWCKISLSESEKELITHMNQSNSDTCYKCGKQGHFASNCRNKKTSTKPRTNACSRCGRDNHKADKCYATTDVDGDPLLGEEVWACSYCQKEFDSEKGASYHERFHCRRKKWSGQSLRQKAATAKQSHAQRKKGEARYVQARAGARRGCRCHLYGSIACNFCA